MGDIYERVQLEEDQNPGFSRYTRAKHILECESTMSAKKR
jgi:hypothetical protein